MLDHLFYTLQLADNALILGHRLGEWCGHGPVLEQDIALTNISLDHIGQARSLYQHAAHLANEIPQDERAKIFQSVTLNNKINNGELLQEDDLPYLRDVWDYRNVLLTEQPNGDWAYTVARSFFYDVFYFLYYTKLKESKDTQLAAIAEKSLKEVAYHQRWSSEWMIRLGDGTAESKQRIQNAVNDYWQYTGELFNMSDAEKAMLEKGIGVDAPALKADWDAKVDAIFKEATLTVPEDDWMQKGGKQCRHSEHLGFILAELQYIQRAYPGMEW